MVRVFREKLARGRKRHHLITCRAQLERKGLADPLVILHDCDTGSLVRRRGSRGVGGQSTALQYGRLLRSRYCRRWSREMKLCQRHHEIPPLCCSEGLMRRSRLKPRKPTLSAVEEYFDRQIMDRAKRAGAHFPLVYWVFDSSEYRFLGHNHPRRANWNLDRCN